MFCRTWPMDSIHPNVPEESHRLNFSGHVPIPWT
jgi:hypothetical protein